MTEYLVVEDTTSKVLGIGSALGIEVSGQTIRAVDEDLTLDRKKILQGTTVTLTNGVVTGLSYPTDLVTLETDNAFLALHAQMLEWEDGLVRYGPDVLRVGTLYLDSGWQAAKKILADSTTYPDATATMIFKVAIQGALRVTSPEIFATSIYAARNSGNPTRAMLWVNTSGQRLALNNMHNYGALETDVRPFIKPSNLRSS